MTGWQQARLGDVCETALGKMLDRGKSVGYQQVRYLRNVNVQWGRIDTHDLQTMELAPEDRGRFEVLPGDLLACEGGEIGRCAIWQGDGAYIAFQKALHRLRPCPDVDSRFLRYQIEHLAISGVLARNATGSTIMHLPQQNLRGLPVRFPRLHEQRRIVAVLEDHLSHLDAASDGLRQIRRRVNDARERIVRGALTGGGGDSVELPNVGVDDRDLPGLPRGWAWSRLGDVAEVVGGVTKDVKKQADPSYVEVPYLRVANVQRAHLRLDSVTTIRVSPAKAKQLRLLPGDVLLNEGGDRDKLARGWIWEGQVEDCIHQNHVFRARVRDHDVVDPRFLAWCANTYGGAWAERNGKQSVNLASISLTKIKQMPVIIPPCEAGQDALSVIDRGLADLARLESERHRALNRSAALRRSLLAAAFSGRL